ncbi:Metalloendopeptidase [Gryllus bimaculatus]|nr:Metalloendopeptidase [Gryllus bimaculatus]
MAAGAKVVRWWRWVVAAAAALAVALGAPLPGGNDLEGPATPSYVQHVLPSFGSAVFGDPDEQIGEKVSAWSNETGVNPEELGEYAEGDILFPATARNGLATTMARWPEGVVPYKFSSQFSYRDQELLQEAFRHYHEFTCIKFVPYTNQPDYIYLTSSNTGCWSSVGRVGGMQESPGCTSTVGTPIHELMHALGFLHEQNRWERDRYVTIHWENILQVDKLSKRLKKDLNNVGKLIDFNAQPSQLTNG